MRRFYCFLCCCLFAALCGSAFAATKHVKWTARLEPTDVRAGESAEVVLSAEIEKNWHFYSLTTPEGGPKRTKIELAAGSKLSANGKPIQPEPIKKHEELFGVDVEQYEGSVAFKLPVKLAQYASGPQTATVTVKYQVCDPSLCADESADLPVSFAVAAGAARPDRIAARAADGSTNDTAGKIEGAKQSGILTFVWLCMIAGIASIFTPCVFPMVPITVSFFSKQKSGSNKYAGPIAYCLGIIGTFTALGVAVTVIFGAAGINKLAANPWVNMGLAVVFIVLAASLFGAFEIVLPSWLVNRAHQGTTRGGLVGPVLMGLTFTLTSFTCTVPVAGTLLASAAQGSLLYPIVGMLAYSTAFAAPFFFLALFPEYLARLPKSGSWLVSVKAVMGFLELAAALKFISNVDLVWSLAFITRPVFLAIWAAIGAVCGLYLLGWLRLPHDDGMLKVGWPRRVIGVLSAAAGLYCLAAINGAPLGQLEAFPPPDPYPGRRQADNRPTKWLANYDEALAKAKATNKAMFINFTGAT